MNTNQNKTTNPTGSNTEETINGNTNQPIINELDIDLNNIDLSNSEDFQTNETENNLHNLTQENTINITKETNSNNSIEENEIKDTDNITGSSSIENVLGEKENIKNSNDRLSLENEKTEKLLSKNEKIDNDVDDKKLGFNDANTNILTNSSIANNSTKPIEEKNLNKNDDTTKNISSSKVNENEDIFYDKNLDLNTQSYNPNESSYNKTKEILNSSGKGEIKLPNSKILEDTVSDLSTTASNKETSFNIDKIIESDQINRINTNTENENFKINNTISIDNLTDGNKNTEYHSKNPDSSNTKTSKSNLKKKSKKSGISFFFIFVLFIIFGFFVLNKMYPEETKNIFNLFNSGENNILNNDIENNGLNEGSENQDNESDNDIDPNSLAGQLEKELTEENGDIGEEVDDLEEYLGELGEDTEEHSSADFDPYSPIDDILQSENNFLEELKGYATSGDYYYNWGKTNDNVTAVKYGSFIKSNAENFIKSIENGEEIDSSKIEDYIVRFISYLSQLDKLNDSTQINLMDNNLFYEPENIAEPGNIAE